VNRRSARGKGAARSDRRRNWQGAENGPGEKKTSTKMYLWIKKRRPGGEGGGFGGGGGGPDEGRIAPAQNKAGETTAGPARSLKTGQGHKAKSSPRARAEKVSDF